MTGDVKLKICGLTDPADIAAALLAGASYLGFVFFDRSPRHLDLGTAHALASSVPSGICKVALLVDATDDEIDAMLRHVPIDMLQLQGRESPQRVIAVSSTFGLPVMKAVGVSEPSDLDRIDTYSRVADQILVDAKPPAGAVRPGGNGIAFDWRLIAGRRWPVPWMLAGGLTAENVGEAVRLTGARQVDVSSGVESAPGVKDAARIAAFGSALADLA